MSTLQATWLQDREASRGLSVLTTVDASTKGWINFDGKVATPIVRASFNMGSILDYGIGSYGLNLGAPMNSAYWVAFGHAHDPGVQWQYWQAGGGNPTGMALQTLNVSNPSGTADSAQVGAGVTGRLA